MPGSVRLRNFFHLPINAPVCPQNISPKSFIKKILPISPTRRRFCEENVAIFLKTGIHRGRGRGYVVPVCLRETWGFSTPRPPNPAQLK
jgi:hypothetical protein